MKEASGEEGREEGKVKREGRRERGGREVGGREVTKRVVWGAGGHADHGVHGGALHQVQDGLPRREGHAGAARHPPGPSLLPLLSSSLSLSL
eukprot:1109361-Rhodomonas_salina.2